MKILIKQLLILAVLIGSLARAAEEKKIPKDLKDFSGALDIMFEQEKGGYVGVSQKGLEKNLRNEVFGLIGANWEQQHILECPNIVNVAKFSPDGAFVVTSSFDSVVRLWDAHTGKLVRSFIDTVTVMRLITEGRLPKNSMSSTQYQVTHIGGTRTAEFSPNGQMLVTGGYDHVYNGTIKIWEVETGKCLHTFYFDSGAIEFAHFNSDDTKIIGKTNSSFVTTWDLKKPTSSIFYANTTVISAVFSPDSELVLTADTQDNNRVRAWHSNDGSAAMVWTTPDGQPTNVLIDPTLEGSQTHHLWPYLFSINFSPDGTKIITACDSDDAAKIWDFKSGKFLQTLADPKFDDNEFPNTHHSHSSGIFTAEFSPDGTFIVTASKDGTVKIWNAKTGAFERVLLEKPATNITQNDEDAEERELKQIATAPAITKTHEGDESVVRAAISPNSSLVATIGSDDKYLKLWNPRTGELKQKLLKVVSDADAAPFSGAAFTDGFISVQFSPDSNQMVTTAQQNKAIIWVYDLTGRTIRKEQKMVELIRANRIKKQAEKELREAQQKLREEERMKFNAAATLHEEYKECKEYKEEEPQQEVLPRTRKRRSKKVPCDDAKVKKGCCTIM